MKCVRFGILQQRMSDVLLRFTGNVTFETDLWGSKLDLSHILLMFSEPEIKAF